MKRIRFILMSILAMGASPQSFLGARWLVLLLWICPKSRKRNVALWILALSPHYFFRDANPAYVDLSEKEFFEAEFERNKSSREKIRDKILVPYLKKDDVVLDYGCGPGFLAKAVAPLVAKVYAVDLSLGVLACARTINWDEKIGYVHLDALDVIPDASVDVIYSIAVIQHVTDEAFDEILNIWKTKLKPGARIIAHVQLEDERWTSEEKSRNDRSLRGQVKLRYGLNCFSRTQEAIETRLARFGFTTQAIQPVASITDEDFDDICHQHLIIAEK